jgi:hypothetical protein
MVEDRTLNVPPGKVIRSGWVDIFKVRADCRERMSVGDVDRAYQKHLQLGDQSSWPPPNGYWDGNVFVIKDGRHEWIARMMLGKNQLFVCWLEDETSIPLDSTRAAAA